VYKQKSSHTHTCCYRQSLY